MYPIFYPALGGSFYIFCHSRTSMAHFVIVFSLFHSLAKTLFGTERLNPHAMEGCVEHDNLTALMSHLSTTSRNL